MKESRVRRLAALLVLLAVPAGSSGQAAPAHDVAALEGRVSDEAGRPLAGVVVEAYRSDVRPSPSGTARTGDDGRYRVAALPEGRYEIRFIRLGYAPLLESVDLRSGERARLDVSLDPAAIRLDAVVVAGEAERDRRRVSEEAGPVAREISGDAIRSIPGLAEGDPLRAVEILPGVVSPSDFGASYNVRGGAADQNLILLDGFPLFNPFHLGGMFSVFNVDLIDRVDLRTGGFQPEFGGRVSSVLAIESDAGPGELQVDAGISVLAVRAAVAGGLEGLPGVERARWRVSARRSYLDQLLRPITELPYSVTDLQGVFEGRRSERTRVTLTAYSGRDVLDLARVSTDEFPLRLHWDWGNDLVGAGWTRVSNGGGRGELRVGASRFGSLLRFTDFEDSAFGSEIEHLLARGAFHGPLGSSWEAGTGLDLDVYRFRNRARSGGTSLAGSAGRGAGAAPWLQAEWERPGAWRLGGGLRLESWLPADGDALLIPSPRVSAKRFFARGAAALHVSAGRYAQFAQSLRDEELPLGIDVWVTAGAGIPHVVSDQLQAGVEGVPGRGWFIAVDAYYRSFEGVITTNPASDPNLPNDDVVAGRGRGYGADVFVERTEGEVTGSLSASWLKAHRRFPDVLSGLDEAPEQTFPPIFDRRLDLDLVLRFPLPREWAGSLRWHVGSGLPFTRPLTRFAYFEPRHSEDGRLRWQGTSAADTPAQDDRLSYAVALGPRNGERYPTYHRLDVSVRRAFHPSWGTVTPYVDILNVYNQPNVLFYFYDFDADPPTRSGLSMFPFLPTVGVEVQL